MQCRTKHSRLKFSWLFKIHETHKNFHPQKFLGYIRYIVQEQTSYIPKLIQIQILMTCSVVQKSLWDKISVKTFKIGISSQTRQGAVNCRGTSVYNVYGIVFTIIFSPEMLCVGAVQGAEMLCKVLCKVLKCYARCCKL